MSWGISENATEKEKIFADYNDSLMGMNSADGLSYRHYSQIYDIGRNLADKEYQQGKKDTIKPIQKFIDDYDGAIVISENMGVISGQQLIDELKEIMEQLKVEQI